MNEIVNTTEAITNTLYTIFGDKYNYYTDNSRQDLDVPCFFVREINTDIKDLRANYKRIRRSFVITFVPELKSDMELSREISNVITELTFLDTIEHPTTGELIRIYDKNVSRVENEAVITFDVYDFYIRTKDTPKLENLEISQEVFADGREKANEKKDESNKDRA